MRRRLGWLLGLLLLLPLAQTAATWHLLSHIQSAQARAPGGEAVAAADHCALCLTALTLKVGALPTLAFAQALTFGPSAALPTALPALLHAQELRPYQSRAPPSFRN